MKALKNLILITILLIFSDISFGQETITRKVDAFTGLSVMGGIRVELYKSEIPELEITIDNVPSENLTTEVKGGKLNIRLKTGSYKDAIVKVKVNYSMLDDIMVSSYGSILSPELITGKNMKFTARSGGKIELELKLDYLKADVMQGAIITFEGEVRKQEISASTGGTYSAYLLEAEESYVKAGSAGKAKVRADSIIQANANSGGYIGFIGDPVTESTKISLGGEIVKFKSNEAAGVIE